MSEDNVYRKTEIVGTASESVDAAIRNGLDRAARNLREVDWFEVTEIRGHMEDGRLAHYQVGMKVGFKLDT